MILGMKFLIVEIIVVCVLLFVIFLFQMVIKHQNTYAVIVVIIATNKSVLLQYDKKHSRLSLPRQYVDFAHIPSETVRNIINSFAPENINHVRTYEKFHLQKQKYDRVRDDIAPSLILVDTESKNRVTDLVYIMMADSDFSILSNKYPYPDFFTYVEIQKMDNNTKPSNQCLQIIDEVMKHI